MDKKPGEPMDRIEPETGKQENEPEEMKRYWVSWWSGNYENEGCSKPVFQVWVSGERDREAGGTELSLCAVIDAHNEAEIWTAINKHFPDCELRFCEIREAGWIPGARFPGYDETRTRLE